MGRAHEARTYGLVLAAVILAGLASLGLLGNYTYFGVAKDTVAFAADRPLVLVRGIIGVGALFSLSALTVMRRIRRGMRCSRYRSRWSWQPSAGWPWRQSALPRAC